MKIGFSSSVCPDWDLPTMVQQAQTMGYEAIEYCLPHGDQDGLGRAGLTDHQAAKRLLADTGIELTLLTTDCSLHWPDRKRLAEDKDRLGRAFELAGRLGCPYVSVKSGSVPRFHRRDAVLQRIAEALREMAPVAAERHVELLVENDGNLAGSRDIWYIVDAVAHPAIQCCWSPCHAQAVGNSAGLAVPRIGRRVAVSHMLDAVFGPDGHIREFTPLGQGQVDFAHYLVLMHGINSRSRLIVNYFIPGNPPDWRELLPASLAWLKQQLAHIAQAPELSAYKGDKNAPRYSSNGSRATAHG